MAVADKELHYLTYDPDEIWREMIAAYVDAGGDVEDVDVFF